MPIDSTVETRQKVPFTAYMAGIFKAEVHILSIYSSDAENIRSLVDGYSQQVMKHLEEENIRYKVVPMPCENLTDATIEYAHKIDANLISIMTEQEKTAKNIILGPYAQQMVNHSPFPVLCIHPKDSMAGLNR
jgi:nucleotide-binding universal stress UspA family protein